MEATFERIEKPTDWEESVERFGFATIPGVFATQEISQLIDDLAKSRGRRNRAGIRHALSQPAVARLARDPRRLGIAGSILGPQTFPFRATLFDKSPALNWLVVWHQDTALPLRERRETPGWGPWSVKNGIAYAHAPTGALAQVLALRIHLGDSTSENGPLRILPGTHTLGVLSDDNVHTVADKELPFDCVISQGGVLPMRPLLIHSSSKSRVESPRRVAH